MEIHMSLKFWGWLKFADLIHLIHTCYRICDLIYKIWHNYIYFEKYQLLILLDYKLNTTNIMDLEYRGWEAKGRLYHTLEQNSNHCEFIDYLSGRDNSLTPLIVPYIVDCHEFTRSQKWYQWKQTWLLKLCQVFANLVTDT